MSLAALVARAVPACPAPAQVPQPDGSLITLRLVGDEFYNYTTTTDGRAVVCDATGAWRYACKQADGTLAPTAVLAHDPGARTAAETAWLALNADVRPDRTSAQADLKRRQRALAAPADAPTVDYKKFRGLVLLVNFSDTKFTYPDPKTMFGDMVNKRGYDGFMSNDDIPKKIPYTGSVRDYFHDQSKGIFSPEFDVVGPVTIPYSSIYPQQANNMRGVLKALIETVDPQVDFTKYDTDGDGIVDMFFIIFAGYGSNYSGNSSYYVWPHASDAGYVGMTPDGMKLGRYACSTEMGGTQGSLCYIEGIGVICHEFSHVLGMMDEYDTDYAQGGGQSTDPGKWSVMADGMYFNRSRTPCGYSLLERYQAGFTVPKVVGDTGVYVLHDLDSVGTGLRINTPEPREYFLLENRRKEGNKWNAFLPGEGMLVFRVDSTNPSVWTNNTINANPAHNYYELLRAAPKSSNGSIYASNGDPFPGSGNITHLTPDNTPPLLTWGGLEPSFFLDSIYEKEGVIYFHAVRSKTEGLIEDFETMTTPGSNDRDVQGRFARWDFSGANIAETDSTGNHAVALLGGSTATMQPVAGKNILNCSFTVTNNTERLAFVRLNVGENGEWTPLTSATGATQTVVPKGGAVTARFVLDNFKERRLQVQASNASATNPIYLDNFTLVTDGTTAAPVIDASAPDVLTAICTPEGIQVSCRPGANVCLYDLQGRTVTRATADADGRALLRPSLPGCYIVAADASAAKVLYR